MLNSSRNFTSTLPSNCAYYPGAKPGKKHALNKQYVLNSELRLLTRVYGMRTLFAAYGLPEQVVSDNGPQFTSEDFKDFIKENHIKHILSTPYHPSTNGLAKRFVQTFKKAMRTSDNSGKPLSY